MGNELNHRIQDFMLQVTKISGSSAYNSCTGNQSFLIPKILQKATLAFIANIIAYNLRPSQYTFRL